MTRQRGGDPGGRQDRRGRRRRAAAASASPATTPTARSTRASPATASRRPTSAGYGAANAVAIQADGKIVVVGSGATSGGATSPSPATTRRLARPELLRRRQADDRLRRRRRGRTAVAIQADGKIVAVGTRRRRRRLRPRPLQPQRHARHELRRRRQGDDRLRRGIRRRQRGGHPGGRQDRRGRRRAAADGDFAVARYNPDGTLDTSFAGDGKLTTDFGGYDEANGVAIQADGKIVAAGAPAGDRRLRPRPLQHRRLARPELLRRRQADDRLRRRRRRANGVALQANGRIVAAGDADRGDHGFRPRPLQPRRLARPELLRRRQADDRLRRRGGANGVALQANGKIVAVGSGLGTDLSSDFVVARYLGG